MKNVTYNKKHKSSVSFGEKDEWEYHYLGCKMYLSPIQILSCQFLIELHGTQISSLARKYDLVLLLQISADINNKEVDLLLAVAE